MKIVADIPVEQIDLGHGLSTYRSEAHEVEVIRVVRYAAARKASLNRWRYEADIKDHPALCPDAIRCGANGAVRVNIMRNPLNPKWKPPTFAPGEYCIEIDQEQQT